MKISKPPVSPVSSVNGVDVSGKIMGNRSDDIKTAPKQDITRVDKLANDLSSRLKSGEIKPQEAFDDLIKGICEIYKVEPSGENMRFITDAVKSDPALSLYAQRIGLDIENM
ncbi:MAG: hypothetical protein JXR95_09095 [Deltaproteobacteria bacterium]|nr:hypothetical protein [Deltaproteobacteria bacterium]